MLYRCFQTIYSNNVVIYFMLCTQLQFATQYLYNKLYLSFQRLCRVFLKIQNILYN